jgi:hypothetical protein
MSRVAIIEAFVGWNDVLMLADLGTVVVRTCWAAVMAVIVERDARSFSPGKILYGYVNCTLHLYSRLAPKANS